MDGVGTCKSWHKIVAQKTHQTKETIKCTGCITMKTMVTVTGEDLQGRDNFG